MKIVRKKWLLIGSVLLLAGSLVGCFHDNDSSSYYIAAPPHNIVFVTSTSQDGNLGGLAGADAICNARAAAAALPGTYVAWLSTSTVDAKDRLGTARGWVRPDGLPFADTVADITAGKIFYPPRLDEFGTDVSVLGFLVTAYTGTLSAGTVTPTPSTCMDWTDNNVDLFTGLGQADATTEMWTDSNAGARCIAQVRLYCFGTDHTASVLPPGSTGRLAFVSSALFPPDAGLAAADTLCQNEATTAALPGTYKALLATEGFHAASRFNLVGTTWVRLDGVKVVDQASDLAGSQFLAPLNLQADGATYLGGGHPVWKGAADFNTSGVGTSCSSWTSAVGDGVVNRAAKSVPFQHVDPFTCSNAAWVYCFQE